MRSVETRGPPWDCCHEGTGEVPFSVICVQAEEHTHTKTHKHMHTHVLIYSHERTHKHISNKTENKEINNMKLKIIEIIEQLYY